ncbi:DUF2304 domain-containing protein [Enorma massiliensis]|uniref:DUF2304 domain-containing protein n=1 Tax=Enorma massiliensis TaxID=1472761 RepID=UPI0034A2C312
MDSVIQVFISVMCVALFIYVVYLVSRERLLLKYSLLWLLLSIVILICAVFPGPLYSLASGLGFTLTSNFVFLLGLFFLMLIGLSLSVIVSKQTTSIKNLTQRLAIVEEELLNQRKSNLRSS